jgi:excisionase family DNA binding protein
MATGPDRLLTVGEASRLLRYTLQHTRLLLRTGRLRGTKIGRDWTLREADVRAFAATRSSTRLFKLKARG